MTTWATESDQTTTWGDAHDRVTNLLPYSSDFTKWTKSAGIEVSANYANSPFADDGMASLVSDVSGVLATISYNPGLTDVDVYRCFSIYIKKDTDTTRVPDIRINFSDAAAARLRLDTVTGDYSISRTAALAGKTDFGVIDDGDFWRPWVVAKHSATISACRFYPAIASSITVANDVSLTGSIVVYGAQLEVGTYPTGLIDTNGSVITDRKQADWARQ